MSGHSHSKTIKHAKGITDQKRGRVFSKLARVISLAAKEGGPNPETNNKLKVVIEQAKQFNLPKENIERAIKQASGATEEANLAEVIFEAYGPGGIALIIEGITENKNRALNEIKQILTQHNGKMVGEGGVQWMFEHKGVITINSNNKEESELLAIESGADDVSWEDNALDIYTKPEDLEKVKENLENKNIKIESSSLEWVAKENVEVGEKDKEACQKLFDALDENEAVQGIYSNAKLP